MIEVSERVQQAVRSGAYTATFRADVVWAAYGQGHLEEEGADPRPRRIAPVDVIGGRITLDGRSAVPAVVEIDLSPDAVDLMPLRLDPIVATDPEGLDPAAMEAAIGHERPLHPFGGYVRLWRGVRFRVGDQLVDDETLIGTYRIASVALVQSPGARRVAVVAYDQLSVLDVDAANDMYIGGFGYPFGEELRRLHLDRVATPWGLYQWGSSGVSSLGVVVSDAYPFSRFLPSGRVPAGGETSLSRLATLLSGLGCRIRSDETGQIIIEPMLEGVSPVAWRWALEDVGEYEYALSSEDAYSAVVVRSVDGSGGVWSGAYSTRGDGSYVEVDGRCSAVSYAYLGRRAYILETEGLSGDGDASAIAGTLARDLMIPAQRVSMVVPPVWWLSPGDRVDVALPDVDMTGVIESITIPMSTGEMATVVVVNETRLPGDASADDFW